MREEVRCRLRNVQGWPDAAKGQKRLGLQAVLLRGARIN